METPGASRQAEPLDATDTLIVSAATAELDDQLGRNRLGWAADVLAAIADRRARPLPDRDVVIALADLAMIAGSIGALTDQTRAQVAAWATVVAHLRQARLYAQDLQRCLNHACAAFAYATCPATPA